VVLGITLPFLNHAYHIDEPLFLKIAQHIKFFPTDPYGFYYLWNAVYEPIHEIAAFPPGFAYYLAAISGTHYYPPEWIIHLSLIPFAILGVLSFYFIMRRFDFDPRWSLLGTLLFAASPAFVISANMAMPDMASISLALGGIALSIRGWNKKTDAPLILGGLLIGLSTLMRYNAVPFIGICFLLGLSYSNYKRALVPTLISLSLFCLWILWSFVLIGSSHMTSTTSIFAELGGFQSRFWSYNIHLTLSTFLPIFTLFIIWKLGRVWGWALLFLAIDLALIFSFYGKIKYFHFFPDALFFGIGLSANIFLCVIVWKIFKEEIQLKTTHQKTSGKLSLSLDIISQPKFINSKSFRNLVLVFWIVTVISIPLIYVHFASKYLIFIQPPLIILLLSYLQRFEGIRLRFLTAAIPIMLLISVLVAHSDFRYANAYRDTVRGIFIDPENPNFLGGVSPKPKVWFTGHWGWQYYLERFGASPLPYIPYDQGSVLPGDFILTPFYASAHPIHPTIKQELTQIDEFTPKSQYLFNTMNGKGRAGFYSNHWGPLPYSITSVPSEFFKIFQVN